MKTEISAGGIVVRKTNTTWLVLLIRDMNNNWTFPKGMIEAGEKPEEAAKREVAEETGLLTLELISTLHSINYNYRRNGVIKKTVHYFLFLSTQNKKEVLTPLKNEGITHAEWKDFVDACRIIGYTKTNLPLLNETAKILRKTIN